MILPKKTRTILILSGLILVSNSTFAFHWFKSSETPPPRYLDVPRMEVPSRSTSAPFDGGLSVLIAAGVAYATKRGYEKRKKVKGQQHI